ncbi:ABC transporter substrate-binding protein [Umezawaea endophytica]|uniref:ABC transporter substrate-binding protein n=1 Tax=Umezawaea endophytica TaxID=1654476 RepID=A0A9X2VFF2_9PSEU|nr:ABC transporter substrate-binding protein [Umezawaea endophytica]MCS7475467.1 ABC transporter substrate-binding protein [Umezawaea endophytica]
MSSSITVPPSRLRRPLWIGSAAVLVVLLVAAFLLVRDRMDRCDGLDDVRRSDGGECVGVSAGESDFGQQALSAVIGRIRQANADVEKGEYVSVAVFLPMTPSPTSIITPEWVVDQLEGARLAQVRHNRSGVTPKVRLLLANPGGDMAHWREVADQVDARRRTSDHVVAVTGIGLSLENARLAIGHLTEAKIPVIASTITADDIHFDGLLIPAPTNSRQAAAAAKQAKNFPETAALMVVDTNKEDLYPRTLADAFTKQYEDAGHLVVEQEQQYDSLLGSVDNAFAQMMPNICAVDTGLVYFAGRGRDLVLLVAKLKDRACADKPIRIFTGDDVTSAQLAAMDLKTNSMRNVEIYYTEVASSSAWVVDRDNPLEETRKFRSAAVEGFLDRPLVFDDIPSYDAGRIMSYDAVLTATAAIKAAAGKDGGLVDSAQVMQTVKLLNLENAVFGASGELSYGNDGRARDKVVPLMKVDADSRSRYVALDSTTTP